MPASCLIHHPIEIFSFCLLRFHENELLLASGYNDAKIIRRSLPMLHGTVLILFQNVSLDI